MVMEIRVDEEKSGYRSYLIFQIYWIRSAHKILLRVQLTLLLNPMTLLRSSALSFNNAIKSLNFQE